MIYLVIGRENSGKSVLAEELAMKTGDRYKYYIATMKVYDEVGEKRVLKHRKQRSGKGFVTIEQEKEIHKILEFIEYPEESTLLLECVTNLVGNELFENPVWKERIVKPLRDDIHDEDDKQKKHYSEFADSLAESIKAVSDKVSNIVIVTNEYMLDDNYDEETGLYVNIMNMINERLIRFSDEVHDLR